MQFPMVKSTPLDIRAVPYKVCSSAKCDHVSRALFDGRVAAMNRKQREYAAILLPRDFIVERFSEHASLPGRNHARIHRKRVDGIKTPRFRSPFPLFRQAGPKPDNIPVCMRARVERVRGLLQ